MLLAKPKEASNLRHQYVSLFSGLYVKKSNVKGKYCQVSFSFNTKQIVIDNFNQKKDNTSKFSPKLLTSKTRTIVKQFQSHLSEVVSNMEYICISGKLIFPVIELICYNYQFLYFKEDLVFIFS